MKFQITATSIRYDQIALTYPCLSNRLFTERQEHPYRENTFVERAYIEIDSLDQLIELSKEVNNDFVISAGRDYQTIEIYDDYRE